MNKHCIIIVILLSACQKKNDLVPANSTVANEGLLCATCPSEYHNFIEIAGEEIICHDFTDYIFDASGDTLGYTESGSQPIINTDYFSGGIGTWDFSNTAVIPGMYGIFAGVQFNFDNNTDEVEFDIYYIDDLQSGVAVNGSTVNLFNSVFPITIGGVVIDLDNTVIDDPTALGTDAKLTLTGDINSITLFCSEAGIKNMCVTKSTDPQPIDISSPVHFSPFYNYSGLQIGTYPETKTPLGYYGNEGVNLTVKFEEFLGYEPTKISFVHAYQELGIDPILNIQLPSTPLITTISDSLEYYLTPYNYQVSVTSSLGGTMWSNKTASISSGIKVDSIVIQGSNISNLIVGANLNASEMRSICSYLE